MDMKTYRFGVLGAGSMGKTIAAGAVRAGLLRPDEVLLFNRSEEKRAANAAEGYAVTGDFTEVYTACDTVLLSVKPQNFAEVLPQLAACTCSKPLVLSIAAGISFAKIEAALGADTPIIRAMPNTPSLVNAGMTSVTPNALVSSEDVAEVLTIYRCFGQAEQIAEPMIHPVVGVSGSAPAYVFMFIEAMADAAVLGGMPRAQAYKFAAQAVMGSAKMVLESGEHPGALKDMVCSPGGTTIEAVRVLEEKGFRSAVIEAITQCMEKSEKLSRS